MSTVTYSKGTVTIHKESCQLTKEEIYTRCTGLFHQFILAEETGVKTGGEITNHYHIAYVNPVRISDDIIRETLGSVFIKEHKERQSKAAAAAYVLKEDKNPMIYNWDDWKADAAKGRYNTGEGLKKAKAIAAWNKDIGGMKELDMRPSEVNRELQSIAPVSVS